MCGINHTLIKQIYKNQTNNTIILNLTIKSGLTAIKSTFYLSSSINYPIITDSTLHKKPNSMKSYKSVEEHVFNQVQSLNRSRLVICRLLNVPKRNWLIKSS